MDINIGNDIQVEFILDSVKEADRSKVRLLECYFINSFDYSWRFEELSSIPGHPFPQYCNPTEYTIRSCDFPTYNVNPVNMGHHMWDRFCGFGVNTHKFCCKRNENYHCFLKPYSCYIPDGWTTKDALSVVFPGKDLKLGTYRFVVKVVMEEDGWGNNNLHEYMIDFGEMFKITKDGGVSGDVELKADTFYIGWVDEDKLTQLSTIDYKTLFLKQDKTTGEWKIKAPKEDMYAVFVYNKDRGTYTSRFVEKHLSPENAIRHMDGMYIYYCGPLSSTTPTTFKFE